MLYIGNLKGLKEMLLDLDADEKRAKHIVYIGSSQRVLKVSQIMGVSGIVEIGDKFGYSVVLETGESVIPLFPSAVDASRDRMWLSNKLVSWLADAQPLTAGALH